MGSKTSKEQDEMFKLGVTFWYNGKQKEAIELWKDAAYHGHDKSCQQLIYVFFNDAVWKDLPKLYDVMTKLAKRQVPRAFLGLGIFYENFHRDASKSREMYLRSAQLGCRDAKLCLADSFTMYNPTDCYKAIQLVADEPEAAEKWITLSGAYHGLGQYEQMFHARQKAYSLTEEKKIKYEASRGIAVHNLILSYLNGEGCKQNFSECVKLIKELRQCPIQSHWAKYVFASPNEIRAYTETFDVKSNGKYKMSWLAFADYLDSLEYIESKISKPTVETIANIVPSENDCAPGGPAVN